MVELYFNEIMPKHCDEDIIAVFEETVVKTTGLINRLNLSRSIVTSTISSNLFICGMSLSSVIASCKSKDVKTQAYYMFTHNLIRDYDSLLDESDYDELLEACYEFDGEDAMNLAIAHKMEWLILSLPLSEALKQNTLVLESTSVDSIEVVNYYAQDDTSFIDKWVTDKLSYGLEGLDRIKALFGIERVIITDVFEKQWESTTKLNQSLIYSRLKFAFDNSMLFPVKSDDVTIQKLEVKGSINVYELRQKGQGLRVYFGYTNDETQLVLAGLHTKAESEGEEQTSDINSALRLLSKTINRFGDRGNTMSRRARKT